MATIALLQQPRPKVLDAVFATTLPGWANRGAFTLPGDPSTDVYLLPVSGGADSTFLAILLHAMFPEVNWVLAFTDTGAEDQEIYTSLDRLEVFLGRKIARIAPEADLWELIDRFGGFLPAVNSRYCTRELKLNNFRRWMAQFRGRPKHMMIGIRADESSRVAFTIDEVETYMPFVDLGIQRADVFNGLAQTIGIPRFYSRRSRSGCHCCPFQRRQELVGLLQESPVEFERGMQYEKLAPEDLARHDEGVPLWQDSGIAPNWLTLPKPRNEKTITGKRARAPDLFGSRIFVGGEFFTDGMYSNDEFVWHQKVISFSPTQAGLARQLDDRYRHLLATSEVFDMTEDDVRNRVRFAIWYVELPSSVFDPDGPRGKGYTWQQGSSYRQLRHVIQWVTRALHAEGMRREADAKVRPGTVQEEWKETSAAALTRLQAEIGTVVQAQWYVPKEDEPELTEEEELALLPCPMCHI